MTSSQDTVAGHQAGRCNYLSINALNFFSPNRKNQGGQDKGLQLMKM